MADGEGGKREVKRVEGGELGIGAREVTLGGRKDWSREKSYRYRDASVSLVRPRTRQEQERDRTHVVDVCWTAGAEVLGRSIVKDNLLTSGGRRKEQAVSHFDMA